MKIVEIIREAAPAPAVNDKLAAIINKNCAPYVAAVGMRGALTTMPLYRGTFDSLKEPVTIVPVRKDRLPMTTHRAIHELIDQWFAEQCGIKFRSQSLFASGDRSMAQNYGATAIVVPCGDFDFAWSPEYADLYTSIDFDERDPSLPEKVSDLMNNGNYRINQGLREAIKSGHEIMFACSSAVLIRKQGLL
jgi:hypothetical protein